MVRLSAVLFSTWWYIVLETDRVTLLEATLSDGSRALQPGWMNSHGTAKTEERVLKRTVLGSDNSVVSAVKGLRGAAHQNCVGGYGTKLLVTYL